MPHPRYTPHRQAVDQQKYRSPAGVLGCGHGRLVGRLLEAIPRGRIVGVDRMPAMLEELRRRAGTQADRITCVEADLDVPLEGILPEGSVDAAISVATLHWLQKPRVLAASLRHVLRPQGMLIAESPAEGNLHEVWEGLRMPGVKQMPRARYSSAAVWRDELHNHGLVVEQLEVRRIPLVASKDVMVPYLLLLLDPMLTAAAVEDKWSLASELCDLLENRVVYRRLLVGARLAFEHVRGWPAS
ncbi:class I SAM-dependent methyltransferase [Streptomyces spiralis]